MMAARGRVRGWRRIEKLCQEIRALGMLLQECQIFYRGIKVIIRTMLYTECDCQIMCYVQLLVKESPASVMVT